MKRSFVILLGWALLALFTGCGQGQPGSDSSGISIAKSVTINGVAGSARVWKEEHTSFTGVSENKLKANLHFEDPIGVDDKAAKDFAASIHLQRRSGNGAWVPSGLKFSDFLGLEPVVKDNKVVFDRTVGWNIRKSKDTFRVVFKARLSDPSDKSKLRHLITINVP